MTNRETMELFIEKNGQETVAYPFVEKDHVVFGNGMGIEEVIEQDVSMPTVTHEEVSFKVGVGDQDVSSSVVDSSVGEMVIKGKTYHNILPEPSTHVLTNSKEMFKVDEGLDPNVEIVDGVAKSAILKGQTLVNLAKSRSHVCVPNGGLKIDNIRENTKYLLRFNFTVKNASSTIIVQSYRDNSYIENTVVANNLDDKVALTFTTKSTVNSVRILNPQNAETNITIDDIMLIEYQDGMENWDIPYFTGMQSVKMPVLTTTGKNLTDRVIDITIPTGTNIGEYKNAQLVNIPIPKGQFYVSFKSNRSQMPLYIHDKKTNYYHYNRVFNNLTTDLGNHKQVGYCHGNTNRLIDNSNGYPYMTLLLSSGISTVEHYIKDFMISFTSDGVYEPYKSNILSTPEEVVLRSLPNGVCDTLNVETGEYVKRIGEKVLCGETAEDWRDFRNTFIEKTETIDVYLINPEQKSNSNLLCDKMRTTSKGVYMNDEEGISCSGGNGLNVWVSISKNKLSTPNKDGFKQWLKSNPMTIQYELATPIIKTVDLSSSGNWEKIVFNGSENWSVYPRSSSVNFVNTIAFQTNTIPNAISTENYQLFSESFRTTSHYASDVEGIFMKGTMRLSIKKSKLMSQDVDGLKQYLQQNPLTVWYQTVVHQDSTQVKQPIFFKDGHIQLSSGADNSLIPTLNYQAKTSNSYVMDLMKTNTKYTMKAKSASGTFTIDGTSYGAGTNGTFTTPSSMTNKFLVMNNKTNEEVMILEGDVTDKTIPYFKGIKSAFEGESKIEVLSTGKNLVDLSKGYHFASESDVAVSNNTVSIKGNNTWTRFMIPVYLKANARYTLTYNTSNAEGSVTVRIKSDGSGDSKGGSFLNTWGDGVYYVSLNTTTHVGWVHFSNIQLIEDSEGHLQYEPYKSNSTKIPLLSPLRSLPNGVCDELIIDRMKKKATLIQRVGQQMYDGTNGNWITEYKDNPILNVYDGHSSGKNKYGDTALVCNRFLPKTSNGRLNTEKYLLTPTGMSHFKFWVDTTLVINQWQKQLSQNPVVIYYQMETPIITEIDLENFPYIYKDGHIFLNSEIAPTTQITYSISQQHQIDASTQDLIRHEQEIDYLYKLIAQYIQVDYQSTLLSLDLKLK